MDVKTEDKEEPKIDSDLVSVGTEKDDNYSRLGKQIKHNISEPKVLAEYITFNDVLKSMDKLMKGDIIYRDCHLCEIPTQGLLTSTADKQKPANVFVDNKMRPGRDILIIFERQTLRIIPRAKDYSRIMVIVGIDYVNIGMLWKGLAKKPSGIYSYTEIYSEHDYKHTIAADDVTHSNIAGLVIEKRKKEEAQAQLEVNITEAIEHKLKTPAEGYKLPEYAASSAAAIEYLNNEYKGHEYDITIAGDETWVRATTYQKMDADTSLRLKVLDTKDKTFISKKHASLYIIWEEERVFFSLYKEIDGEAYREGFVFNCSEEIFTTGAGATPSEPSLFVNSLTERQAIVYVLDNISSGNRELRTGYYPDPDIAYAINVAQNLALYVVREFEENRALAGMSSSSSASDEQITKRRNTINRFKILLGIEKYSTTD